MNNKDLVSVIMPAYNAEAHIKEAILSVLNQTYKNIELIITDDFSSDSTFSLISEMKSIDNRIMAFKFDKNKGAAEARNNCIKASKGRYLAFLDADDIWIENKLELQINFMEKVNSAFSFTGYSVYIGNGYFDDKIIDSMSPDRVSYRDLLKKTCTVGCSTVVIDRSVFNNIEMENIRTGQDYALWLKLLRESNDFAYNYKIRLTGYRIVKGSISRNKIKKAIRQWKIYRDIEKINFLASSYYMLFYVRNALLRK